MPESDAQIQAEGGKTVSISIEEVTSAASSDASVDVGSDPNTFVIYNGKYKLTITIAE